MSAVVGPNVACARKRAASASLAGIAAYGGGGGVVGVVGGVVVPPPGELPPPPPQAASRPIADASRVPRTHCMVSMEHSPSPLHPCTTSLTRMRLTGCGLDQGFRLLNGTAGSVAARVRA